MQIGFYKNEKGKIQVVSMPVTVEKVPNQLPSEITSLKNMFSSAFGFTEKFNQDISKWDTSKVTNMLAMFESAKQFNQDISKWNVSNVEDMSYMFYNAKIFNQVLSKWNVEKVTEHKNFSVNSGIDNSNKLPKFKN